MNGFSRKAARICAIISLGYMVPASSGSAQTVRAPVPNVLLADGSMMPFPLSRYRASVVVLQFWSQSCAPCLKELESLNRLQGDMPGKPVMVLAVSEDNASMAMVRTVLQRQKLTFLKPFADPNNAAAQALNLRGLPTSLVIDKHGNLVMEVEGPQPWDRKDYENRILLLANEAYP